LASSSPLQVLCVRTLACAILTSLGLEPNIVLRRYVAEHYILRRSHGLQVDQACAQTELMQLCQDVPVDEVGHGIVVYNNEMDGCVAICPWDVNATDHSGAQRNRYRAYQIQALVRYLSRECQLGSVTGAPWLVSQFFSDGVCWRGVVWNASPDAVSTMQVSIPSGMDSVAEVTQLDADGNRFAAGFRNGELQLSRPLHQWECVVLYDGKPEAERASS
jgi:hypothetical protein